VPVWLYVPLVVLHVIVAVALILIVLLQAGKGAGIGAAFGGASQTVFGPRGPGNFLSKLTTAAAGIFMVTSLVLAIFSSQYIGGSVIMSAPVPRPAAAPTTTPSGGEQTAPNVPGASEGTGTVDAGAAIGNSKEYQSRRQSLSFAPGRGFHFRPKWWNLVDTPS
jgi:preprotein translocase subunit SecG